MNPIGVAAECKQQLAQLDIPNAPAGKCEHGEGRGVTRAAPNSHLCTMHAKHSARTFIRFLFLRFSARRR